MLASAGIVVVMFAISAAMRIAAFDDRNIWFINQDAPYAVLLVMKAFAATPVSIHHYLPLVTLGNPMDKGIPWGETIPDALGNYYYISFPTLGYLVPYFAHAILGIEPTLFSLLLFNLGVHLLCTWLVVLLALRCLRLFPTRLGATLQSIIVVLAAATYLFAREAFYAHGPIYWHHSLFQLA